MLNAQLVDQIYNAKCIMQNAQLVVQIYNAKCTMHNAQLVVQIYNAELRNFSCKKSARTLDKNYMTLKRIFATDRQKILLKNLSSVSIDFFVNS